jgi:phosphoglycerol transferase MdoB-like AlkP superfamily enzyme
MKENIGWASRALVLPLVPAILGTALRIIFAGHWALAAIDASELAFCLGLVSIFLLSSVSRLADKPLRDALFPLFVILLALSLCLFAGSVLIRLVHEADQSELMATAKAAATATASDALRRLGLDDRCTRIANQIRNATLFTGSILILLGAAARLKYAIED